MTKENKLASRKSIIARLRDGEVGCCHLPWLTLRRMMFVLALAFGFCWSVAEASIPLTVKCRFDRANDQADIGGKSDLLWVFVLDHSGSMDRKDATSAKTGRRVTRWEALKDGFDETVKSIPLGSKVQVYCVGGYGFWSRSDYAHRIYSDYWVAD